MTKPCEQAERLVRIEERLVNVEKEVAVTAMRWEGIEYQLDTIKTGINRVEENNNKMSVKLLAEVTRANKASDTAKLKVLGLIGTLLGLLAAAGFGLQMTGPSANAASPDVTTHATVGTP